MCVHDRLRTIKGYNIQVLVGKTLSELRSCVCLRSEKQLEFSIRLCLVCRERRLDQGQDFGEICKRLICSLVMR